MRLSRRDFLKKSVAGAIGVAAAGVVGIPAMAEEEKEALYIPGTYSATAKGYESDVKVTMTFTESKITEVVDVLPAKRRALAARPRKRCRS